MSPAPRPDPATSPGRLERLLGIAHDPAVLEARARRIHETILASSRTITTPNFTRIGTDDLEHLLELYDRDFFDGQLDAMRREDGSPPVGFRLSSRMTSKAGLTTLRRLPASAPGALAGRNVYEIAVSTALLFEAFRGPDRTVSVGGLVVSDRLEALQRIVEHELLHLAEFLATGHSNCTQELFQHLSRRIFGHAASTHDLITPRERAAREHQIQVGNRVAFDHEGTTHVGVVNRITKRATVLVEHPAGELFSDGRRYKTFYVPVPWLRKVTPGS